jgi:hypothetical protein
MHLPNTQFRPPPEREIPAIVRMIPREDVVWNRPTFKAPPLVVPVPSADSFFAFSSAPGNPGGH